MKRKKVFLFIVIYYLLFSTDIFGEPFMKRINPFGSMILEQLFSMIDESEIPLPEVQYELPETLVGEFFMVSVAFDHVITIFPNNKYFSFTYVPDEGFFINESYGYIVKKDDKWYFSPLPNGKYIRKLTEITLTDSGFSYYLNETWLLNSVRRENIPIPVTLAEEITVPLRFAKRQYFIFNDPAVSRIDFNEIEVPINGYFNSFIMRIDIGIVKIYTIGIHNNGINTELGAELFEGFIEKTEETDDILNGIIKFTNGPPYYYIRDGIAEIEMKNDGSIIITMFYSPRQEIINQAEILDGVRFPAKLILEF